MAAAGGESGNIHHANVHAHRQHVVTDAQSLRMCVSFDPQAFICIAAPDLLATCVLVDGMHLACQCECV